MCGTSRASTVKPSALKVPGATAPNDQSPRRPRGVIGKCGGDIPSRQHLLRTCTALALGLLLGQQQGDPGVLAVAGREERQPVHVIPVQVREQDRAGERLAAQQPGDPAQAGAGVEDEPRAPAASSGARATHEVWPP